MYNLIGGIGTGLILFLTAILLLFIDSYIFVCGILSIIYISVSLTTFFKIKETERVETEITAIKQVSYKEVLKDRNFLIFELAQCFWNFSVAIIMASITSFAVTIF